MNGPKLYTHYKGDLYIVLDLCDDSNNENPHEKGQIAYLSVERQMMHTRSVEEFFEEVEWPDGYKRPRFLHTPTIDHIPIYTKAAGYTAFNEGVEAAWKLVQDKCSELVRQGVGERQAPNRPPRQITFGELLDLRDEITLLRRR